MILNHNLTTIQISILSKIESAKNGIVLTVEVQDPMNLREVWIVKYKGTKVDGEERKQHVLENNKQKEAEDLAMQQTIRNNDQR